MHMYNSDPPQWPKHQNRAPVTKTSNFDLFQALLTFLSLSGAASCCNATIYKYLFVVNLVGEKVQKFTKWQVIMFMVFLQFVWPIVAALSVITIDLHPERAVVESRIVSFFVDFVDGWGKL
jgi:hypothetical protein